MQDLKEQAHIYSVKSKFFCHQILQESVKKTAKISKIYFTHMYTIFNQCHKIYIQKQVRVLKGMKK